MESSKFEYRAVIKFSLKEGCTVTEIHQRLVAMYGNSALNYCTVTRWFNEFTRSHVCSAFGRSESHMSRYRYCRKTDYDKSKS